MQLLAVSEKYGLFLLCCTWQLYLKENVYPLARPVLPTMLRSGQWWNKHYVCLCACVYVFPSPVFSACIENNNYLKVRYLCYWCVMCWQLAVSDDRLAESLWQCTLNVVQGLVKLSLEFRFCCQRREGAAWHLVMCHHTALRTSSLTHHVAVSVLLPYISLTSTTPPAVCCCITVFPHGLLL